MYVPKVRLPPLMKINIPFFMIPPRYLLCWFSESFMNSHIFIQLNKSILLIFLMVCNNLGKVIKVWYRPLLRQSFLCHYFIQAGQIPSWEQSLSLNLSRLCANICSLWKMYTMRSTKRRKKSTFRLTLELLLSRYTQKPFLSSLLYMFY